MVRMRSYQGLFCIIISTKMDDDTTVLYRTLFHQLFDDKKDVVKFGVGAPNLSILEKLKPLLREATKKRLESGDEHGHMFQYGATRGDHVYIEGLKRFLTTYYHEPVCSNDLICTAGATMGNLLLATLFFRAGDYVFVEDPTYFIALEMFKHDLKLHIVTVPMESDGVNVGVLDQLLTEYDSKLGVVTEERPYRAMFYTIPVYHNPTGYTLSEEKGVTLIKTLRKHDILAVCDDVYNVVHYGQGPPPKRLFSYDKKSDSDYKGNVVSNGSFSKLISPGMRLGWYEAPQIVVTRMLESPTFRSGGCVNQYTSAIVGTALKHDILKDFIEQTIQLHKSKLEQLCDALDKYMNNDDHTLQVPEKWIEYDPPKGGYFVWVKILVNCDTKAFSNFCLENDYKVLFRAGILCSPSNSFTNYIRLSSAAVEPEDIETGVKTLRAAFLKFLWQI